MLKAQYTMLMIWIAVAVIAAIFIGILIAIKQL